MGTPRVCVQPNEYARAERQEPIVLAYRSDHSRRSTGLEVAPLSEPTASTALTSSIPPVTLPKTQCLPSSQSVLTVHRKNWEPLVLGPAFAMERVPAPSCLRVKFSSANFSP